MSWWPLCSGSVILGELNELIWLICIKYSDLLVLVVCRWPAAGWTKGRGHILVSVEKHLAVSKMQNSSSSLEKKTGPANGNGDLDSGRILHIWFFFFFNENLAHWPIFSWDVQEQWGCIFRTCLPPVLGLCCPSQAIYLQIWQLSSYEEFGPILIWIIHTERVRLQHGNTVLLSLGVFC